MARINSNWRSASALLHPFSPAPRRLRLVGLAVGNGMPRHGAFMPALSQVVDKCVSGACLIMLTPVIVAVWIAIRRCAPILPVTGPGSPSVSAPITLKPDVKRPLGQLFPTSIGTTSQIPTQAHA